MKRLVITAVVAVATTAHADVERYVQKQALSDDLMVVVAEGELEPRSIGSYSVRVYEILDPAFPTDNFVVGIIKERDGTVEQVIMHNLDKQGEKEIIVTVRSVGTGSYLSAHAFRYDNGGLTLLASLEDLPKDADPVSALKRKLKAD